MKEEREKGGRRRKREEKEKRKEKERKERREKREEGEGKERIITIQKVIVLGASPGKIPSLGGGGDSSNLVTSQSKFTPQ